MFKKMVALGLACLIAGCASSREDFWTEYTGPVRGTYATYERSYSQAGLEEAVLKFDIASYFESKSLKEDPKPFKDTETFKVLKYYRYNVYIRMHREYLIAQKCAYQDDYTQNLLVVFPYIKEKMHATIASLIVKPIEESQEKQFSAENFNCADRGLTRVHNGETWTRQRLWGVKMEFLADVMRGASN